MLVSQVARNSIARSCFYRSPLTSYRALSSPLSAARQAQCKQFLRFKTTTNPVHQTKQTAKSNKLAYPEKLLIYHAGTGRTVFVGCLKVTTIFVFAFFALVVAPAHFYTPDEPKWISAAVLITGIIPFIFVTKASGPFVNYVHLHLPPYARYSREFVHRYSMALPRTATIDITTMNLIGKPRVNRMQVSELRALTKPRIVGGANFERIKDAKREAVRKWWMGREVRMFSIRGGEGNVREKGVWDHVAKCISRNSLRS